MYHPSSDVDNDEFLELYNTTSDSIDISGWCFTSGITLCFSPNTSIAGHSYAVVSPNSARTSLTYSITTIGTYTGKLSNSGEAVTLKDAGGVTMSTVTYATTNPWPSSPDGNGPSLELRDPTLNLAQSQSWGASILNGGTPGVGNSITDSGLPQVGEVGKPTTIYPSEEALVTAHVQDASTVVLLYKVMFESEQSLTMYDDGSHGDSVSGDGFFSARIPTQAAGKLVRYKISATNGFGSTTSPSSDETILYYGYVVQDGASASIPIFRWYMDTTDFTDMTTNHLLDDATFPAVIVMGDQLFDNATVRVKGESSVNFPKRKYKFELPQGHTLSAPYFEHAMDEFSIQVYFLNFNDMQEHLAWNALTHFGFSELQNRYVRVHSNQEGQPNSFYGHYLLIEDYDKTWRERTNHQNGALYKEASNKKTRLDEDSMDILTFHENITTLHGAELKKYLLDNLDIPNIINFNAVSAVIGNDDWSFMHNMYEYRDTEGTGRWSVLPWDLDNAMVMSIFKGATGAERMEDIEYTTETWQQDYRYIENAIMQFPEFREMYYRRVSTVYDELYRSGLLLRWFNDSSALSETTVQEDNEKWSSSKQQIYDIIFPDGLPFVYADDFPYPGLFGTDFSQIPDIATMLNNLYRYGANRFTSYVDSARMQGRIKLSQQPTASVLINEISYVPVGGTEDEFIELYNPSTEAIDISGWKISNGVSITMPQGSVVPANGYGLIVKNDTQFRTSYGGNILIYGEYSGNLSNDGEAIQLTRANGSIVSEFTYGVSDDWPTSPVSTGRSIGLIRSSANEALSSCWAPSREVGGTPGEANALDIDWINDHSANCTDKTPILLYSHSRQAGMVGLPPLEQILHVQSAGSTNGADETSLTEKNSNSDMNDGDSSKRSDTDRLIQVALFLSVSVAAGTGVVWSLRKFRLKL